MAADEASGLAQQSARSQRPAIFIDCSQRAMRRNIQHRASGLRRRRPRGRALLRVNRFHGRAHRQRLQGRRGLTAAARTTQRCITVTQNCCRGAAAALSAARGRPLGKRRRCKRNRRQLSAAVVYTPRTLHDSTMSDFTTGGNACTVALRLCSYFVDHDHVRLRHRVWSVAQCEWENH